MLYALLVSRRKTTVRGARTGVKAGVSADARHQANAATGAAKINRHGTITAALVALLATVLAAGITAYATTAHATSPPPAAAAPTGPPARITMPNASIVSNKVQVLGVYRNLPTGTSIWVSTFDPKKSRFFPQDKPCVLSSDVTFDCGDYYIGDQYVADFSSYRLDVLFVNQSASQALLQYQIDKGGPTGPNPGLSSLPEGADIVSSRDVQRSH